jgi:hypothetical protein
MPRCCNTWLIYASKTKGQVMTKPHAGDPAIMAYGYSLATCNDPLCGIHLTAHDSNDKAICEVVIKRGDILTLIEILHKILYHKAVNDEPE